MKRKLFLLTLLFLFTTSTAHADLLVNAGFDADCSDYNHGVKSPGNGTDFYYLPTGSNMGWTFTELSGVIKSGASQWGSIPSQDGSKYAFIQGTSSSTISQTFKLDLASDVTLSLYLRLRAGYPQTQTIQVLLNGVLQTSLSGIPNDKWVQYNVELGSLSADTEYTLKFAGTAAAGIDTTAFIDNVTLSTQNPTATPIPSAFLFLGPGLAGLAVIRKKFIK